MKHCDAAQIYSPDIREHACLEQTQRITSSFFYIFFSELNAKMNCQNK